MAIKAKPNVYSALVVVAFIMLAATVGFVVFRANVLFGGVGELFNFAS